MRHFALFFIPLLCFALVVGSAHGSPFPRCKKASSRCVGFVIGFIVGFYIMIYAAWCLCLCAYGFVEMCRYFRKRRKTIPYNGNSFVPGAVEKRIPWRPGLSRNNPTA